MKQVRIRVTCDACAAWHGNPENEDGVETVPVGSGQTLDLCASHRSDLAPLLSLIAEWGASPDSTGRAGSKRRWVTPTEATSAPEAPAPNGNAPTKRGGKRARQRRANAAQALPASDAPLPCPICQHPAPTWSALSEHTRRVHSLRPTEIYGGTCPVCAHETSARGLGMHAGSEHQVPNVAALFAMAQQQDDPHGVVAARAQALAAAQ
jgi:hypothetical protein